MFFVNKDLYTWADSSCVILLHITDGFIVEAQRSKMIQYFTQTDEGQIASFPYNQLRFRFRFQIYLVSLYSLTQLNTTSKSAFHW